MRAETTRIEEHAMPGYHRLCLPDAYRALTGLCARDFAWEWLRRNPDFRAIWASAGTAAERAAEQANAANRRAARGVIDLPQHPLTRRLARLGLTFRASA